MKKPVIAVTPLYQEENHERIFSYTDYMEGVRANGGIPILLPIYAEREELEQVLGLCDGLLVTGGPDVDPALYGEAPHSELGPLCTVRDVLEWAAIEIAMEQGMPILGICRGMQLLNVFFGGTLYQDLPSQRKDVHNHSQVYSPDAKPLHKVIFPEGSLLLELSGLTESPVNSYHHQAVKDLGEGLAVTAVSDDGLIEGFCLTGDPYVQAVQWHPERTYLRDELSSLIFADFVRAAAGEKA